MIDEVRATGAIFRPWVLANNRPAGGPEHDPLHDWQCRTPAQLFTRLLDRLLAGPARQYAADVISAVDAHPPNRVVCSMFAVGAMVGAEAACIPYDVLMPNIYLLPARGCRRSDSAGSRRPARLAGSATWLSPSPFSANGTRAATASASSVSRTVGGLLLRADLAGGSARGGSGAGGDRRCERGRWVGRCRGPVGPGPRRGHACAAGAGVSHARRPVSDAGRARRPVSDAGRARPPGPSDVEPGQQPVRLGVIPWRRRS